MFHICMLHGSENLLVATNPGNSHFWQKFNIYLASDWLPGNLEMYCPPSDTMFHLEAGPGPVVRHKNFKQLQTMAGEWERCGETGDGRAHVRPLNVQLEPWIHICIFVFLPFCDVFICICVKCTLMCTWASS